MSEVNQCIERFYFNSEVQVFDLCNYISGEIAISDMRSDFENESEWYSFCVDSIDVNISKSYEADTFNSYHRLIPMGNNYLISFRYDSVRCETLGLDINKTINNVVLLIEKRTGSSLTKYASP